MADYLTWKKVVLECTHRLTQRGALVGSGGNVSHRIPGEDKIAITPSSKDYLTMKPKDICIVDFNGELIEGEFRPSVETGMHLAVYKNRLDVNAIVHTHQIYASIFAVLDIPIPALFDEQVLHLGSEVAVISYGISGSPDLANNVASKMDNKCNAYILKNHGALLLGISIENAERNSALLEKTATVYYHALASGKPISTLPESSISAFMSILIASQQAKTSELKER